MPNYLLFILTVLSSICCVWINCRVICDLLEKSFQKPPYKLISFMCSSALGLIIGSFLIDFVGYYGWLIAAIISVSASRLFQKLLVAFDNIPELQSDKLSQTGFNKNPSIMMLRVLCTLIYFFPCLLMNDVILHKFGLAAGILSFTIGTFLMSFVAVFVILSVIFLLLTLVFILIIVSPRIDKAIENKKDTRVYKIITCPWLFVGKIFLLAGNCLNYVGSMISRVLSGDKPSKDTNNRDSEQL